DLVVLVYVDNDIVSTRALFELQAQNEAPPSPEAERFLARTQSIGKLRPYLPNLSAVLLHLYVQSSPAGQQGSAGHATEVGLDLEAGWEASRAALLRMQALLAERGTPFAVLDHYRGTELSAKLAATCAEASIPHGHAAFTPDEFASGITNSAADPHANPAGHRLLARKIMAELERLRLIDRAIALAKR
ncbi:MAG: hypothetical protein AAFZ65_14200, partial [Planctomycetota bacterium]